MLNIKKASLYEVSLPLRTPFRISGGTMTHRRSLIVALHDDRGNVGYGESAPFEQPFYSSETLGSVKSCLIDTLLPVLLSHFSDRIAEPAALSGEKRAHEKTDATSAAHIVLSEGIRGNHFARAGVETAWWDLLARRCNVSLVQLVSERLQQLGVPEPLRIPRAEIPCGIALGIPTDENVETLCEQVRVAITEAYHRIKIKIRPEWDVEPIRAVQQTIKDEGADLPLWADANGAYDAREHTGVLEEIDQLGLAQLEQPFPAEAIWDLKEWNAGSQTPICLDETLESDLIARQVLDMGGPTIWNIKIQRVGGLEEACRIYARGVAAGAELWLGTMPETGLGAQPGLALAAHPGFVHPSDLEPSARWYAGPDLVTLEMDAYGKMEVPDQNPIPPPEALGPSVAQIL